MGNIGVIINDFKPINIWKPDLDGKKWLDVCCDSNDSNPFNLIDQSTGRKYLNESKGCVGFKSFLLIFGTPIVHSIATIVNIVYRVLKLIALSHFWVKKQGPYDFKSRLQDAGKDLLRIIVQLIVLVGLEFSAIYGIFRPYDGRKLYASLERAQYGNFILAPCFQPDPERHLFGGDMTQRNAY